VESVAPGLNARSITVLAVHDKYTGKSADALCGTATARKGALYKQFALLNRGRCTDQQHGVGFYNLTSSGQTVSGKVTTYDVAWQKAQAACLVRFNNEWKTHGVVEECVPKKASAPQKKLASLREASDSTNETSEE
jgi:hypothetical protein